MSLKLICCVFAAFLGSGLAAAITNSTSAPSGKLLSLFSVVRFPKSLCYGTNGNNGTCLTTTECTQVGGVASGTCASGFGICCTVTLSTCGSSVVINNTYWTNTDYPSAYKSSGQCTVNIRTGTNNICQLRLDFINFMIANPDKNTGTATQCLTDIFTVSGESNDVPGLCGTVTNQHMYLDVTPSSDLFTLNMILSGTTTTTRLWNIRISQIPCGTTYTAPAGCLQWFTDAIGTIQSFNYQFNKNPVVQHLANQDYTICIRTNQGFCGICYQVCDAPSSLSTPFLLSAEATTTIVDTACLTDFIQIPCAVDQQSAAQTLSGGLKGCTSKICGSFFSAVSGADANAPVYSYRKPFEVRVFTDSYDATTAEGYGFCLKYQQQPCNVNNG